MSCGKLAMKELATRLCPELSTLSIVSEEIAPSLPFRTSPALLLNPAIDRKSRIMQATKETIQLSSSLSSVFMERGFAPQKGRSYKKIKNPHRLEMAEPQRLRLPEYDTGWRNLLC